MSTEAFLIQNFADYCFSIALCFNLSTSLCRSRSRIKKKILTQLIVGQYVITLSRFCNVKKKFPDIKYNYCVEKVANSISNMKFDNIRRNKGLIFMIFATLVKIWSHWRGINIKASLCFWRCSCGFHLPLRRKGCVPSFMAFAFF